MMDPDKALEAEITRTMHDQARQPSLDGIVDALRSRESPPSRRTWAPWLIAAAILVAGATGIGVAALAGSQPTNSQTGSNLLPPVSGGPAGTVSAEPSLTSLESVSPSPTSCPRLNSAASTAAPASTLGLEATVVRGQTGTSYAVLRNVGSQTVAAINNQGFAVLYVDEIPIAQSGVVATPFEYELGKGESLAVEYNPNLGRRLQCQVPTGASLSVAVIVLVDGRFYQAVQFPKLDLDGAMVPADAPTVDPSSLALPTS